MSRISTAVLLLPAILVLALQGCGKKEEQKSAAKQPEQQSAQQVTIEDIRPGEARDYDCDDPTGMTPDKRFWCRGERAWESSDSFKESDNAARDEFIQAWKLGSLDAQQGNDPAMDNLQSRPVAADGYESGYVGVLDAMGVVEYECTEGEETDNEFRDRWCEAADSYTRASLGASTNAVLRGSYINGYMAGRAIALTLPTSMESLFGSGDAPKGNDKKAIDEPDANAPRAIRAFYKGFNNGFQAMLDTVRESVNQVMEQMQGMEGGMPGMDGMPPQGMEPLMPAPETLPE